MKRKAKPKPEKLTLKKLLPPTRYTRMNKVKFYIIREREPLETSDFKIKVICTKCEFPFTYETNQILLFHKKLSSKPHLCIGCQGTKRKVIRMFKIIDGKKVTVKTIPIRKEI